MKYTVNINEAKRTVTVTLADGSKGTAKCCPTDSFNISTGIELALERAKQQTKMANQPTNAKGSVAMCKELENTLPKGDAVLIVAGGDECLTEAHKKWLRGIIEECHCESNKYTEEDLDDACEDARREGYDEGLEEGYNQAKEEYEISDDYIEEIIESAREELGDTIETVIRHYL